MSVTESPRGTHAHAAYHHASLNLFGANNDHRRKGGPEAWTIWILATVFVVWLFAIQTGYAIVSPDIQSDADLSIAQVGLAASIYTWVFAVVQFFSGALLDRFGLRPLMTISVSLVTIGAFLYAATTSFPTLVLAQVVLAVGSSFGFVGAGYVGGKWFDAAKYGLMFGLVQMFAALGSAVAQPVISAFLNVMTWKQLLVGFGSLGVLLVVGFAFLVRNPAETPEEAAQSAARDEGGVFSTIVSNLAKCFANRDVLLSAIFAGASFGALLAVGVLWGPRVSEARGESGGFAALVVAMAWVGLAFGSPIFNLVSDRWHSRKWPSFFGLLFQGVAMCLFIYAPIDYPGVNLVLMFAFGFFSGAHMLGFTIGGEAVPPELIGSAAAIVNGFCFILGGVMAAVPGWLLPESPSLGDFQHALAIMVVVMAVGTVSTLLLREPSTVRE